MVGRCVYLDNHATTRVDPRVVEAMLPYFTDHYGNAASTSHAFGWAAKDAVDAARESIAAALNASPREIVFTSGATESNNLAIRGVCQRSGRRGQHLVSVVTEHRAVLDPLAKLARGGFEVTYLPVRLHGAADAGTLDLDQDAGLSKQPMTIARDKPLHVQYGIAAWDGHVDKAEIEQAYQVWQKETTP